MSAIVSVFRKEMIDHLRDRRSMLAAMIYPLMGPLLLGVMFVFLGSELRGNRGAPLVVPIVNADSAPDLVRYLEQRGSLIKRLPSDASGFVAGGGGAFALILPERPVSNGQSPLPVRLITDPSKFDSIIATGHIIERLNEYQREAVRERLDAAGLHPDMLTVIDLRQENIGRAAGLSVILLGMIPPFLIFTLFTGGVHVVLDSLNGERERGSFEALMINPVTRNQVVVGKLGAAIVFTLMALAVQAAAFGTMLNALPPKTLGLSAPPDVLQLAIVISVCLPLVFLAASAQLLISALTRSLKEAQTYLALLPLVPMLAGTGLALTPLSAGPLLAAIPTLGQSILMAQVMRNETASVESIAIAGIATLVVAALLIRLGLRLFEREGILFPR